MLGYTIANDVSARDWQLKRGGGQWSRGKTFDTFTPLGPALVTRDEIPNPNALRIRTILNGATMQDSGGNAANLLLNGLTILKDKTAYILAGIFIAGCILLRTIGLK